jgi:hypothetical protein
MTIPVEHILWNQMMKAIRAGVIPLHLAIELEQALPSMWMEADWFDRANLLYTTHDAAYQRAMASAREIWATLHRDREFAFYAGGIRQRVVDEFAGFPPETVKRLTDHFEHENNRIEAEYERAMFQVRRMRGEPDAPEQDTFFTPQSLSGIIKELPDGYFADHFGGLEPPSVGQILAAAERMRIERESR